MFLHTLSIILFNLFLHKLVLLLWLVRSSCSQLYVISLSTSPTIQILILCSILVVLSISIFFYDPSKQIQLLLISSFWVIVRNGCVILFTFSPWAFCKCLYHLNPFLYHIAVNWCKLCYCILSDVSVVLSSYSFF